MCEKRGSRVSGWGKDSNLEQLTVDLETISIMSIIKCSIQRNSTSSSLLLKGTALINRELKNHDDGFVNDDRK